MMTSREQLITQLSHNLKAKPPGMSNNKRAILWWAVSWIYVAFITLQIEPLRPGVWLQLLESPQFLIESLLGFVASLMMALTAWRTAVPGALTRRWLHWTLGITIVWVLFYVVGIAYPALEPSRLGERAHCYLETFLYTVPPSFVACVVVAKLMPLKPLQAGFFIGVAAGMIPGLFMQFACFYDPIHILQLHLLPGLVSAVVPFILLPALLKRKQLFYSE